MQNLFCPHTQKEKNEHDNGQNRINYVQFKNTIVEKIEGMMSIVRKMVFTMRKNDISKLFTC